MLKKNASQLVLSLMLIDSLILAFNIQPAGATVPTYTIKADGSIDPPTALILRSGNVYTFTSDISGSIIVERDNIVVNGAGHTLQGTRVETGIDLSLRTNVTIQNMAIKTFDDALYLYSSNRITISGTNITDNAYEGIYILSSSNNTISENNITANTGDGVYLSSSSNNTIFGNDISNNWWGVTSYYSSNNRIFHNNFINNPSQANLESSLDIWDEGYPSGGNYWSNYHGVDTRCGPNQDHAGGDGIGDTPYTIDTDNTDRYPLMNPWTPPAGHNVAVISVVSSKTVIGQGYSGDITVYGANKGEYLETYKVTIYANTIPIASTTLPLESGSTTTLTFSWNTAGFALGSYTINAYATPVPGEIDTADNTFIDGTVQIVQLSSGGGGSRIPYMC